MIKQSIIFFGSGIYTIPIVKKLLAHNLLLVVTTEKVGELVKFCELERIKYISTNLKNENDIKLIQESKPTLAILASYGAVIPESIIKSIKNGIINIHPSLLPRWKGPSPIQYTLLNSDTQTGVTLIKLDNEIDHGNILSQTNYKLKGDETTKDLLDILFLQGAEMVEDLIIKLENGENLIETPQNHSQESWSYKIEKKDGEINMSSILDIGKLKNMIRAYYPWPGVWLRYSLPVIANPSNVIATLSSSKEKQSNDKRIATSPSSHRNDESSHPTLDAGSRLHNKIIKLLPQDLIQVEGKNPMNYNDFINGFGEEGENLLTKLQLI